MLAVIISYPDHSAAIPLLRWLNGTQGIPWENIVSSRGNGRLLDASANEAVRIALESTHDEFLFCQRDIFPMKEKTAPFMAERKFDFQCVKYPTECADAFASPNSFHAGMWRCNRAALEKMGLPVFRQRQNASGTSGIGCDCDSLPRLAALHGLTCGHVGEAFHVPRHKDGLPDILNLT